MLLSRQEKLLILEKTIQKLNIHETEKELYIFSMNILDSENLDIFFNKIMKDFQSISLKSETF